MQPYNPEAALADLKREMGEYGGVNPSVSTSAMYAVTNPEILSEIFKGIKGPEKGGRYLYTRHTNPTVDVLSRSLSAMEGTEAARCTASGMAAISCTLLQLCKTGDHIVASRTVYGGTYALLSQIMPEMGICSTFVDPTDITAVAAAITHKTRLIYVETVGNPTLKIADITALAKMAQRRGIKLVVDNTFSPMVVSPALLGADVVVYSMTKFISGGGDIIAGAICSSKDFIETLADLRCGRTVLLGPTLDATVAFKLIQRLPHLAMRMREHGRRALAMARKLEALGVAVTYPGLATHPQHRVIDRIRNKGYGYGGMLTIDCGTTEMANALMDILQNRETFGHIAVSLGYYDTLMSCSGSSTSSEIAPADQAKMGLSPGLVRFSIGLTGALENRLKQLERAVMAAGLIS